MPRRQPNRFEHLSDGRTVLKIEYKGQELDCFISTPQFDLVKDHRWHARRTRYGFYVARNSSNDANGEHQPIYLHSVLFGPGADHKDGNGLNNVISNLRPATRNQQSANTRKRPTDKAYKGVYFDSRRLQTKPWRMKIGHNGNSFSRSFKTEIQAAKAYDRLARKLFGPYACLNFPRCGERKAFFKDIQRLRVAGA